MTRTCAPWLRPCRGRWGEPLRGSGLDLVAQFSLRVLFGLAGPLLLDFRNGLVWVGCWLVGASGGGGARLLTDAFVWLDGDRARCCMVLQYVPVITFQRYVEHDEAEVFRQLLKMSGLGQNL